MWAGKERGWFTSYLKLMLQPSAVHPRRLQLYDRSWSLQQYSFGLQTHNTPFIKPHRRDFELVSEEAHYLARALHIP